MPVKTRIFTVFHQRFDERLVFGPFTDLEIDSWFTLYGVNEAVRGKQVFRRPGRHAAAPLLEYELPRYDLRLQARGFMETSCYVHVLANGLQAEFDYIGVNQYDMRWSNDAAELIRQLAASRARNTVYGLSCGALMNREGQYHPYAFPALRNWDFLLESYNRFFKRNWDPGIFVDKPFTLWQTYLMPRGEFESLAAWLTALCDEVYPWANEPPYETHWGVLGGYTERAESVFVAARLHERGITFESLPLEHDERIAEVLGIAKAHYGATPGWTAADRNRA